MKSVKGIIGVLSVALLVSACNMNNTTKGGLIGGAGGGALGAGLGDAIGALAGGSNGAKLGAAIGAGVGVAGGTTAGILIGKKMDKAKAAAEAVPNAEVSTVTDKNGLEAVKVSFDNGILFKVGKSNLQAVAQQSLQKFASSVLNVYTDCDVAIYGFASSDGSEQTNLTLSQNRANAVRAYLTGTCGVNNSQIKSATGYGEDPNYLVYDANGKEDVHASRRVEVYLYASERRYFAVRLLPRSSFWGVLCYAKENTKDNAMDCASVFRKHNSCCYSLSLGSGLCDTFDGNPLLPTSDAWRETQAETSLGSVG